MITSVPHIKIATRVGALFGATMALVGMLLVLATQAHAEHDHGAKSIVVEQAWARASAGAAKSGAAYVTLSNVGDKADRLVAVDSEVAERVEIHTHVMTDNVMKMMEVEGGVEVEPGSPTVFKPGGLHIMFMGLKERLVEGNRFSITLTFENAGAVEAEVTVQSITAMEPDSDHDHGHGHDHSHNHGS